ncbi:MAG: hypothetical protein ACLF0P_03540 [Thermoanaerobaculia bacterium]
MRRFPAPGLLLLALALVLSAAGCSDAGETDTGGVELVLSDFDELPTLVSVNVAEELGLVSVGEIELESLIENPDLGSSDLQTIELTRYEVRFSRNDTGTRVPPTLVDGLIGTVPPGGTTTLENLPILRSEQLQNPPLSDLLFVNGGFDRETGSSVILLDIRLRFFGRTLGGRDVATSGQSFTVEFQP